MKKCPTCKLDKDLLEFSLCKSSKDGHQGHCKECRRIYTAEHRIKNAERHKEYRKKYYHDNKEECIRKKREWEKNNKDHLREYWRKSRKKYADKNRIQKRKRNNERRKTDVQFKILTNLRNRTVKLVKGKNKSASTKELLGCDLEFLLLYFKEKYNITLTSDMIGRGIGKWSIDHIRPCASFDLTDYEQQKQCFHYTNLQPMLYEENAKKKDKIII